MAEPARGSVRIGGEARCRSCGQHLEASLARAWACRRQIERNRFGDRRGPGLRGGDPRRDLLDVPGPRGAGRGVGSAGRARIPLARRSARRHHELRARVSSSRDLGRSPSAACKPFSEWSTTRSARSSSSPVAAAAHFSTTGRYGSRRPRAWPHPCWRAAFPTTDASMPCFTSPSSRRSCCARKVSAAPDRRRSISAGSLRDASTASGSGSSKPWDTAAGALLVEEAGGRVSDFRGGRFDAFGEQTLASNGWIHEEMLELIGPLL